MRNLRSVTTPTANEDHLSLLFPVLLVVAGQDFRQLAVCSKLAQALGKDFRTLCWSLAREGDVDWFANPVESIAVVLIHTARLLDGPNPDRLALGYDIQFAGIEFGDGIDQRVFL